LKIIEGQPGPQPGGNRAIALFNRLSCTEDVLTVRNLRKCFLNYEAKSDRRYRTADETCMPTCICWLRRLKRILTL